MKSEVSKFWQLIAFYIKIENVITHETGMNFFRILKSLPQNIVDALIEDNIEPCKDGALLLQWYGSEYNVKIRVFATTAIIYIYQEDVLIKQIPFIIEEVGNCPRFIIDDFEKYLPLPQLSNYSTSGL